MDDQTKPAATTDQPSQPNDAFSIPVTVAKSETPAPSGVPSVPLETVEPPTDNVPPPAPSDVEMPADDVPPAPLAATPEPTEPMANPASPTGKTLQELLAEEEARNPSLMPSSQSGKGGKGKSVTIIVIVLLMLALIGGAVFAYIQTNKKVKPATDNTSTTAPAATTTTVSGTDIDKTSSDLDASLKKVDDTKDYTANDLTDTTLGL